MAEGTSCTRESAGSKARRAWYGVPHYWIADPDAWTIEGYRLAGSAYELLQRMEGEGAIALAPFVDLRLVPASIWPAPAGG